MSQLCLPHLRQSTNPHILNIAPPLNLQAKWFAPHVAYTMAKYGMSMCVLGMAAEVSGPGDRSQCVMAADGDRHRCRQEFTGRRGCHAPLSATGDYGRCRTLRADAPQPRMVADGSCWNEEVLHAAGVTDWDDYAVDPSQPLLPDFFLEP